MLKACLRHDEAAARPSVIPAQAGIQGRFLGLYRSALDSRFRGNDKGGAGMTKGRGNDELRLAL